MTDASNNNQYSGQQHSSQQQSEDSESSPRGRAYGLSGIPGENFDGEDTTSGSPAGDASQTQHMQGSQPDDNGLASDAMGSGAGSDLMDFDDDEDSASESGIYSDGTGPSGITGGR